ncbi:hypothetical protein A2U01_0113494, partial [Trifolium medium]|nr:hypothetical protein [Trifolium medium]
ALLGGKHNRYQPCTTGEDPLE